MCITHDGLEHLHGSWTELRKPEDGPVARSSHDTTFVDGKLYVFGGEHEARVAIDSEVWVFTKSTNTWETLKTSGTEPEPRVAHAQGIIDGCLYITGGRQGVTLGEKDMNDLFKLDLASGEWTELKPAGEVYSPRSFHQACTAGGKLYVFGGCPGHDRAKDLYEYDPSSNMWSKLPEADMRGRGGAGFTADSSGSNLFVLAGFAGEEANDCYKYDIAARTWSTIPSDTLRPRSVFGVSTLGSKIVIFGGEVDPSAYGHSGAGDFANDLVVLDTETLAFSEVVVEGAAPLGRGWTRIAGDSEGSFLLFGGLAGDDANPMRLEDMWACNLTLTNHITEGEQL